MNPYWLLRAFVKTTNISHATTIGLESTEKKQLNPAVSELIENLRNQKITQKSHRNFFVFCL
jgi:hypothetical protein